MQSHSPKSYEDNDKSQAKVRQEVRKQCEGSKQLSKGETM